MNEWQQKSLIRFLAQELKAHCREVMAYQLLAAALAKSGVTRVDEMLAACRQSPELQRELDAQFADLEAMLPTPDEASSDREILELLSKWKSPGRPN